MKGLSELLIIVVTVIVILIAAFVMVTIFGKGTGGIVETSDAVRATAHCEFRCGALCLNGKLKDGQTPTGYSSETVTLGDQQVLCTKYAAECKCGIAPAAPAVPPK